MHNELPDTDRFKSIKPAGQRRWYDDTFAKNLIDSFEKVPPYKRNSMALKICDIVDSIFKNEINKKVNTHKDMVLGMYKEFEKRRWYDQNPAVLKAVKAIFTLANQRRDLQKLAINNIIDTLGEYYIREEVTVEVRPSEPEAPIKKETQAPPEIEIEPEAQPKNKKLMVSGEKLFIKRDKKPKKPKPKL